jgi:hypothetical protein
MAPTTRAAANWAISHVLALPELWARRRRAQRGGGAWPRLTGVCVAGREGAKVWLRTFPRLLVCGGDIGAIEVEGSRARCGGWIWGSMPSLPLGRCSHACCAVRGGVVVLGVKKEYVCLAVRCGVA